MIFKPQNAPFVARKDFPVGSSDVGVQIVQFPEVVFERTEDVTEIAPGVWEAHLTAPAVKGDFAVLWDAGGGLWRWDDLRVTGSVYSPTGSVSAPPHVDGLVPGVAGTVRIEPLWALAPQVTIVSRSDGETLFEGVASPVSDEEGVVAFDAPVPALEHPDVLTVTWSGPEATISRVHEVAEPIATVAEVRRALEEINVKDVPAERIASARDYAQARLEQECGVAFRPRMEAEIVEKDRSPFLLRWPMLRAVLNVDGVEEEHLPSRIGRLDLGSDPFGRTVAYVHGWEFPPVDVRAACVSLARHYCLVNPKDIEGRATSMQGEYGSYRLVTPGVRGTVFPLPEVNSVVRYHRFVRGMA